MREAVIVASSRTALAKSFRRSFNLTRPEELAAHCIEDLLRKTRQVDPREIEDVILGCGQPHVCDHPHAEMYEARFVRTTRGP
jgi:acetyl-CoA acyltransferase